MSLKHEDSGVYLLSAMLNIDDVPGREWLQRRHACSALMIGSKLWFWYMQCEARTSGFGSVVDEQTGHHPGPEAVKKIYQTVRQNTTCCPGDQDV